MKVLLVGAYPPPFGGIQVHLVQLERFFESQGHTCFVINMGKNKALKSSKLVSPRYAFQVAFHLIKKRDYVCHLHLGGFFQTRLLLLALFSNLLFYKRCAITVHSGGLPGWGKPRNPFKRFIFWVSFNLCVAVICVNSKIADFFQQIGVKSERIHIIPPFTFQNNLTNVPLPEPIGSFIKEKKPLLCNIGLLEPEYDLELLLRGFRRFVQEKPEAGLIMIGSGSLHATLENMISELDLKGKALLAGDINHSDTMQVLASSDCFIRASRYDGDSISLKEAIHLGVPAIATDTGIRPKEAILFRIGDEEGLLMCIRETISAPLRQRKNSSTYDLSSLSKVESVLSNLL